MAAQREALLRVEELRTEFRSRRRTVHAVNGVSFELGAGETLGIVGESGCGKSVTALALLGILPRAGRVTTGSALFGGRDLIQLSDGDMRDIRGREIAMIFQDPMAALNPVLTIGRQIGEVLKLHLGLDERAARGRAIELLEHVGIGDAELRLAAYPHQLSGGMRQRVMIAIAVACQPSLLIADEPTTALDVTIQAQILDLIRRLRSELGTAVILITHDLGVVAGMCERVAVMYAGYVVEEAPVGELFRNPRHPYTIALLQSVPRPDRDAGERLVPIEGVPPELDRLPVGCPFAPRCRYVQESCRERMPSLDAIGPEHKLRCFVDTSSGRQREPATAGR
ncbi:MAG TPA: ABC transporter ATP-binding protein [Chloroflexota bacterium]